MKYYRTIVFQTVFLLLVLFSIGFNGLEVCEENEPCNQHWERTDDLMNTTRYQCECPNNASCPDDDSTPENIVVWNFTDSHPYAAAVTTAKFYFCDALTRPTNTCVGNRTTAMAFTSRGSGWFEASFQLDNYPCRCQNSSHPLQLLYVTNNSSASSTHVDLICPENVLTCKDDAICHINHSSSREGFPCNCPSGKQCDHFNDIKICKDIQV